MHRGKFAGREAAAERLGHSAGENKRLPERQRQLGPLLSTQLRTAFGEGGRVPKWARSCGLRSNRPRKSGSSASSGDSSLSATFASQPSLLREINPAHATPSQQGLDAVARHVAADPDGVVHLTLTHSDPAAAVMS